LGADDRELIVLHFAQPLDIPGSKQQGLIRELLGVFLEKFATIVKELKN
jgi:hypothetical protein